MDGYNHRSKRRRLEPSPVRPNGFVQSPTESSSDELAAGSEHEAERRRASWSIQKAVPPKRPYRRSRSYSGSESPDELTMDAQDYWRSRGRGRKSPSEVSAEPSSEQYQDEDEDAEEEGEEGAEVEEEDVGVEGDAEDVEIEDVEEIPADVEEPEAAAAAEVANEQPYSDRSPTPVPPPPPPPPPKPDKLNYQQKFLLRGHLRGVSAVKFSPDVSMIASGGE